MPTTLRIARLSKRIKNYDDLIRVKEQRRLFKRSMNAATRGLNTVVSNWSSESRPEFSNVVRTGKRGRFFLYLYVEGTDTQLKRWRLLDTKGRERGKVIASKQMVPDTRSFGKSFGERISKAALEGSAMEQMRMRRKKMRFQWRNRKTHPGDPPQFGGTATVFPEVHFADELILGGITPRFFTRRLILKPLRGEGSSKVLDVKYSLSKAMRDGARSRRQE